MTEGSGQLNVREAIVTIDLDSTLADTQHRHELIDREGGTDWHRYSKACRADTVIEATATLIRLLYANYEVHFVTGRMGSARAETEAWLNSNRIVFDGLWMDDNEVAQDYSTGHDHAIYKLERIRQVARTVQKPVVLHVDDWALVKVHLEAAGIPTLCVRTPQEISALADQEAEFR